MGLNWRFRDVFIRILYSISFFLILLLFLLLLFFPTPNLSSLWNSRRYLLSSALSCMLSAVVFNMNDHVQKPWITINLASQVYFSQVFGIMDNTRRNLTNHFKNGNHGFGFNMHRDVKVYVRLSMCTFIKLPSQSAKQHKIKSIKFKIALGKAFICSSFCC